MRSPLDVDRPRVITTADGAELGTNVEPRRAGEVCVSVIAQPGETYAWVSVADARAFAQAILVSARDSEDMQPSGRPDGGHDA